MLNDGWLILRIRKGRYQKVRGFKVLQGITWQRQWKT